MVCVRATRPKPQNGCTDPSCFPMHKSLQLFLPEQVLLHLLKILEDPSVTWCYPEHQARFLVLAAVCCKAIDPQEQQLKHSLVGVPEVQEQTQQSSEPAESEHIEPKIQAELSQALSEVETNFKRRPWLKLTRFV